jgi:transporter family protein
MAVKRTKNHKSILKESPKRLHVVAESKYSQSFNRNPMSTAATPRTRKTIAGIPAWVLYSLLTIVFWGAWGAVSKVASAGVDSNTNQVFFTIGLLPLILIVLRSRRLAIGTQRRSGMAWAFFTGILGGMGNIAFFHAFVVGGKASIVVPATALFPVVTVLLAAMFLHERLGKLQMVGLMCALVASYLLSM